MRIPNLCKNSSLLIVVSYTQLLAVALYLLIEKSWSLPKLGVYSLYLQWWALGCVFTLCWLREPLSRIRSGYTQFLCAMVVCLAMFLIVELTTHIVGTSYLQSAVDLNGSLRRLLACIIFLLIAMRVVALLGVLEVRANAESDSRIQALQSRIRPHFLFNSLNTISELAASRSEHAEHAINSLAMLFRATLETESKRHTLESELNLCRRYESLERWRLSDRLSVDWQVNIKDPAKWVVPKLILQPLLENGITHGVEADGSVNIEIDVRETSSHLSLRISNGIDDVNAGVAGNGIALENIRERLFVMYDDQQTLKVNQSTDTYSIIMRLPKQTRMEAENRA